MRSFMLVNQSGCLLPALIILNLFFGLTFFNFLTWLMVGAGLVLLFFLQSYWTMRKIVSAASPRSKSRSNVIDVEGEVVDQENKNKRLH